MKRCRSLQISGLNLDKFSDKFLTSVKKKKKINFVTKFDFVATRIFLQLVQIADVLIEDFNNWD